MNCFPPACWLMRLKTFFRSRPERLVKVDSSDRSSKPSDLYVDHYCFDKARFRANTIIALLTRRPWTRKRKVGYTFGELVSTRKFLRKTICTFRPIKIKTARPIYNNNSLLFPRRVTS